MLNLLVREAAGEGYNCSLGGCVVEQVWSANVMVDRCAGDDRVTALHLRKDVFREEEEWVDVCIECSDPLFLAQLRDRILHHLEPMIQHQNVDSSHCLDGLLDHILASLVASQICLDEMDLAAFLSDKLLCFLSIFLFFGGVDNGSPLLPWHRGWQWPVRSQSRRQ